MEDNHIKMKFVICNVALPCKFVNNMILKAKYYIIYINSINGFRQIDCDASI